MDNKKSTLLNLKPFYEWHASKMGDAHWACSRYIV